MVYVYSYHYNMEAVLPIHKDHWLSGWLRISVGEFLYTQQAINSLQLKVSYRSPLWLCHNMINEIPNDFHKGMIGCETDTCRYTSSSKGSKQSPWICSITERNRCGWWHPWKKNHNRHTFSNAFSSTFHWLALISWQQNSTSVMFHSVFAMHSHAPFKGRCYEPRCYTRF